MRSLALLLLTACAPTELTGEATPPPPPSQTLDLAISPAIPGEDLDFTVTGLRPGETVWLARGIDTTFGAGGCPPALGGLCIDLVPPMALLGTATADASGTATRSIAVPVGVPIGEIAGFQAVARRGVGGANSTKSPPVLVRIERPMTLSSPSVLDNSNPNCDIVLPPDFWCDMPNPEIRWTDVPANAVSLMFLYSDSTLGGFAHWGVWNIPPTAAAFAPGSSGGPLFPVGAQEISLSGGPWYGSCSGGRNTYSWRLVALDRALPNNIPGSFQSKFNQLETYAAQHGIGEVELCQQ